MKELEWDNSKECTQCGNKFIYLSNQCFFDDNGYGYSTKLCRCPHCNQINVIKHYEDYGLEVNKDKRFYF